MNTEDIFAREVSPAILLLDLQGRRNHIAGPTMAIEALKTADKLQELGGTAITLQAKDPKRPSRERDAILLYYRSHHGRPVKEEIARVARVIQDSRVVDEVSDIFEKSAALGKTSKVTGRRAVVFPEMLPPTAETAAFLVSTSVWFNANRAIVNFPATEAHEEAFLRDINARLTEGQVSLPH